MPSFDGLRYQSKSALSDGLMLSPSFQIAYVHDFAPARSQIGTLAALPGSTFLVDGAQPSRDAAQVKAGVELSLSTQSALFASFDGKVSGQARFYGGKGGVRYVW